jgi:hypothetical protein
LTSYARSYKEFPDFYRTRRLIAVHTTARRGPVLEQMNPINTPKPNFRMIHFNIILLHVTRSSEWSFPFRLPNQSSARISHHPQARYMPCPFHPPLLDNPNNIWRRVQNYEAPARVIFSSLPSLHPSSVQIFS